MNYYSLFKLYRNVFIIVKKENTFIVDMSEIKI